jgi:hypothetical protein
MSRTWLPVREGRSSTENHRVFGDRVGMRCRGSAVLNPRRSPPPGRRSVDNPSSDQFRYTLCFEKRKHARELVVHRLWRELLVSQKCGKTKRIYPLDVLYVSPVTGFRIILESDLVSEPRLLLPCQLYFFQKLVGRYLTWPLLVSSSRSLTTSPRWSARRSASLGSGH